ncbi:MAG TPA: cupin domain-containing protein [Burkholderiales bacterium]|nr:cupin domain-containing protein [Burkholderiales bacterium]
MSRAQKTGTRTRTAGAVKAGEGRYIFPLTEMAGIEAGTGYSTGVGPVVEGERMQCALVTKRRGTGSNAHYHPNEQWNYIVKGKLRVSIGQEPERICGPGTLLYFPANVVHYTIATEDEDVVFFAVKDMTHGIIGTPVDPEKGAYIGDEKR